MENLRESPKKTCQECGGSGETMLENGDIETCENCNGEGYIAEPEA